MLEARGTRILLMFVGATHLIGLVAIVLCVAAPAYACPPPYCSIFRDRLVPPPCPALWREDAPCRLAPFDAEFFVANGSCVTLVGERTLEFVLQPQCCESRQLLALFNQHDSLLPERSPYIVPVIILQTPEPSWGAQFTAFVATNPIYKAQARAARLYYDALYEYGFGVGILIMMTISVLLVYKRRI